MTDETDWISAHAFYQAPLDTMLREVVAPLTERLAADGLTTLAFFLRYWDGGSHLRLRLLPSGPDARDEVRVLVADEFHRFFTRYPAPDVVDPEEYARSAAWLARWENLPSYAPRMYANNSVAFIPYRREHGRYGYGDTIEAVERHFAESSAIVLSLVTAGMTESDRPTAALAMIMIAWFAAQPDPALLAGAVSARTDGRLAGLPNADRDELETRARAQHDRAVAIAVRMRRLASMAARLPSEGTLAAWAASVARLHETVAADAAGGGFTPPRLGWEGSTAGGPAPAVFPVLDICAHLACNRLGISVTEEGFLRAVAARAVAALGDGGA